MAKRKGKSKKRPQPKHMSERRKRLAASARDEVFGQWDADELLPPVPAIARRTRESFDALCDRLFAQERDWAYA